MPLFSYSPDISIIRSVGISIIMEHQTGRIQSAPTINPQSFIIKSHPTN